MTDTREEQLGLSGYLLVMPDTVKGEQKAEEHGMSDTRSSSSNITYLPDPVTGVFRRQPTYEELYQLLRDSLENLRLMRQLQSLPDDRQAKVLTDGYELFDRWQQIRGMPKFGEEERS